MAFQDILGIINVLIIGATGWVVWLYTKAAQRSNEIQEQPLINFYFTETPNAGGSRLGGISLKNTGKGPAYNISFEPIVLQGYRYQFYLGSRMLESDKEESPRAAVKRPDGATEAFEQNLMWFLTRLGPQTLTPESVKQAKDNPAFFLARYQGTNGKDYYSVFALYYTLPVAGNILMQFLAHGSGDFSLTEAKDAWKKAKKVESPFTR